MGPGQAIAIRASAPAAVRGWDRLFAWQREGAAALASGAVRGLWWGTGLGKTSTALAAIGLRERDGPALVVTRAIGREAWARDAGWIANACG